MTINTIHTEKSFEKSNDDNDDEKYKNKSFKKNHSFLKATQPSIDAAQPIINSMEQHYDGCSSPFTGSMEVLSSSLNSQNFFLTTERPRVLASDMAQNLVSLEDKLMQLCFVSTAAIYEMDLQNLEVLVEVWKISGLIFNEGDITREKYLMDCCDQVTSIPLLYGHDFSHSFNCYYEDNNFLDTFSSKDFYNLGLLFAKNNLKNNIYIQCEMDAGKLSSTILSFDYQEFERGIEDGRGMIGAHVRLLAHSNAYSNIVHRNIHFDPLKNPFFSNMEKSKKNQKITFCDLTCFEINTNHVIESLKNDFDAFLLPFDLEPAVRFLCELVRSGKITPPLLEKATKKMLQIKEKSLQYREPILHDC
ncbi:hypothetical protein CLAVI_000880 [Candidatus Clavichlamydia salmonicola]|uniref:hypothetical protein n=1 Tax=Candidatus Clavichlamydia salmonicola TaxID=469812 RepID=UPI001891A9EC|nr:hypothetical protein [Candidatus Clavichlamydia salmonicola]MBF5051239.1 hypothetical protein [Candidatus Clavichlamydia salmonicola]